MSEHAVTNSTVSGTTSGVVGIDVSKLKFDVFAMRGATSAATPGAATSGHSKVFENKCAGFAAFTQWLVHKGFEPASTQVCMEATGPYSEQLALALVQTGWQVSVVNPARVKGFAQSQLTRNKTDRADAALLARFCHTMKPDLWEPPTVAVRQLRAWVERCQALKDMKQQEMNRIEALSAGADASVCAPVNKQLSEHVLWLDAAIAKIEAYIDRHIDNHPDLWYVPYFLQNSITHQTHFPRHFHHHSSLAFHIRIIVHHPRGHASLCPPYACYVQVTIGNTTCTMAPRLMPLLRRKLEAICF